MSSDGGAVARKSTKYKMLISSFIDGQVSAQEFQSTFLKMSKNDNDFSVDQNEFDILQELFADVDDFSADPEYRKWVHTLDVEKRKLIRAFNDEELRDRAHEAYRKLYET